MKKRIIAIAVSVLLLLSCFSSTAFANSAQTWWAGTDASGIIITDGECPVTVKNELLTFNIPQFPKNYYQDENEMTEYSSSVTAQYTFYNPSSYSVKVKLYFPFGNKPMYFYERYDPDTGGYVSYDDTSKYEILLNDAPVEKKLRFTLDTGSFDTEKDIASLRDTFTDDEFYYPEMPVTQYMFSVSGIDSEKYNAANAAFDIDPSDKNTRYYFVDQSGYHTQQDGKARLSAWADNGDVLTVYVIGDTSADFPEWSLYKNGGVENREKIDGSVILKYKTEMTFRELALTYYDSSYQISEEDWYNAVVDNFNYTKGMLGAEGALKIADSLLRWYEYEIEIPAQAEAVNTVNAPIYPEIDSNYSPAVYDYTYLLSPAKTWADFGKLTVKINTPFFLVSSEGFSFTKTDGGYTFTNDGLPEGELEFRLSSSETPIKPAKGLTDYLPIELIISFSIISGALAVIIISAVLIKKHYKKKKYN